MIPECMTSKPEKSFDVKIEDVVAVLDKDHKETGSVDKAVRKLKKLLSDHKEQGQNNLQENDK